LLNSSSNRGKRVFHETLQKTNSSRGGEDEVTPKKRRTLSSIRGRQQKNHGRPRVASDSRKPQQQKKEAKYGPKASEIYKIVWWYDIFKDPIRSRGGFKGSRGSGRKPLLDELTASVSSGTMLQRVEKFQQVPYNGFCTRICDSNGN